MGLFWIIMAWIGIILSLLLLFIFAIHLLEKYKEYKENKAALKVIEDTIVIEEKPIGYQEEIVNAAMGKLNALEGLASIKSEMNEIVQLIKYDIEEGQFDHRSAALHMVFLGNPGTGKTTVARIVADIYKGLGVLEKGHLVEADRTSLVGQYIGHTAQQTKSKIESAFGGLLFIDEAYNLIGRGASDFGIEAIDTLLKMMEDSRGKFIVVVAGYDEEMMRFLASNPGLKSRFDKIFHFEDHGQEELWTVCLSQFAELGKKLDLDAENILKAYINHISNHRQNGFGNAREIRKIVNEVAKNQKLRLANMDKSQRTDELKSTILSADTAEFTEIEVKYRKQIGYKFAKEETA
jgi:SpoVK/Ycf46/Vps4 family AAA+-type ATPase